LRLKPKNVPPVATEATIGHRLLKHAATGKARADVIDHVFRYGGGPDKAIAGDWNGDGIDQIGARTWLQAELRHAKGNSR
jgi:hypothetical protein